MTRWPAATPRWSHVPDDRLSHDARDADHSKVIRRVTFEISPDARDLTDLTVWE
jgi:hypothetical protein